MRSLSVLVVVGLLSTNDASAEARLELRLLTSTAGRPVFGANAYLTRDFSKQLGLFAWLQLEEKWAEGYGGISFSPRPWGSLSLGAGLEQAHGLWRVGGALWLGNDRVSSLMLVENGASGWWYQSVFLIKLQEVQIGAMIKRGVGVGPRIDLALPGNMRVWVAYLPVEVETGSQDWMRLLMGLNVRY